MGKDRISPIQKMTHVFMGEAFCKLQFQIFKMWGFFGLMKRSPYLHVSPVEKPMVSLKRVVSRLHNFSQD